MTSRKKKAKTKARKTTQTKKKSARKATKARRKVTPIPEGYRTVTASLIVNGAAKTIEFCKKAFGAKVKSMIEGPNGFIAHAVLKIGDSLIHIGEATSFTTTSSVMLYVKNADKTVEQALEAGAEIFITLDDMFWGDRYGVVKDPQGNLWEIATRTRHVSPSELKNATRDGLMARSGQRGG